MRLRSGVAGSVVAIAAVAAVVSAIAMPASAAPAAGTWGRAQQVATGATRQWVGQGVVSAACAPAGYCAAVGTYWPRATLGITDPYVVIEQHGTVGKLQHIDTSALVNGPLGSHGKAEANMDFVTCPSAGNCAAVGDYNSFAFGAYPFVVSEVNGKWGKAHPIAGIPALGFANTAMPSAIACSSAGDCVAGGTFGNSSESQSNVPFLVSEQNGVWGAAEAVPGTPPAADVVLGNVGSLSCTAGDRCVGVGFDQTSTSVSEFVITEHNGVWGTAGPIPGLPTGSAPSFVSCASSGICTVAGYGSGAQLSKLFTVSEKNGHWGHENLVPGTNVTGQNYDLVTFACPAANSSAANRCVLGGWHSGARGPMIPFIATQHTNGSWSHATNVPGMAALDKGFSAQINQLSCGAPGNCSAGGVVNVHVTARLIKPEAFVVSETGGTWGKALVVPGIVKLDTNGISRLGAMACWSADHCVAGGTYEHSGKVRPYAFIVTES